MSEALRTFSVLLAKRASVETSLLALAKRAARKGLTAPSWTGGKPYACTVELRFDYNGRDYGLPLDAHVVGGHPMGEWVLASVPTTRIDLTLSGETPRYAGWTFAAALQHLE